MRWDLRDVKVGDELVIDPGPTELLRFVTASRVADAFIVDSEGAKWKRDGRAWGEWRWSLSRCRPSSQQDEGIQAVRVAMKDKQREFSMRDELSGIDWDTLSPETIRAVHALVFPEGAGGGA